MKCVGCPVQILNLKPFVFYYTVEQWLQMDLGPPSLVTAIETKGRGDTGRRQWVTKYRLAFSNDSVVWQFYEDKLNLEQKVCHKWLCNNLYWNIRLHTCTGIVFNTSISSSISCVLVHESRCQLLIHVNGADQTNH